MKSEAVAILAGGDGEFTDKIGLLLPAVQSARKAARMSSMKSEYYEDSLEASEDVLREVPAALPEARIAAFEADVTLTPS